MFSTRTYLKNFEIRPCETQDNNEGLNSIIWSRVPKNIFVSKSIIEMGTYSVILHFNDDINGILQVSDYFNVW